MKKLIVIGLLFITGISCNKILGKTCWECEVTRMDGSTYKENVCNEDGNYAPQFTDANGNDLNSFCKKK